MSPEILEEPNNSDPVHFAKTELFGSATFYGAVIISDPHELSDRPELLEVNYSVLNFF